MLLEFPRIQQLRLLRISSSAEVIIQIVTVFDIFKDLCIFDFDIVLTLLMWIPYLFSVVENGA